MSLYFLCCKATAPRQLGCFRKLLRRQQEKLITLTRLVRVADFKLYCPLANDISHFNALCCEMSERVSSLDSCLFVTHFK